MNIYEYLFRIWPLDSGYSQNLGPTHEVQALRWGPLKHIILPLSVHYTPEACINNAMQVGWKKKVRTWFYPKLDFAFIRFVIYNVHINGWYICLYTWFIPFCFAYYLSFYESVHIEWVYFCTHGFNPSTWLPIQHYLVPPHEIVMENFLTIVYILEYLGSFETIYIYIFFLWKLLNYFFCAHYTQNREKTK
jgi:hypothetical protein